MDPARCGFLITHALRDFVVAETLSLLQTRTDLRLAALSFEVASLRPGRGGELGTLVTHVIDELKKGADACREMKTKAERLKPELRKLLLENATQRLERMQSQLDVLHIVLATYQGAVARSDVPVGVQHLVDVLMERVLVYPGDPIIHLNARNMYSTVDIVHQLSAFLAKVGGPEPSSSYEGRHPIAFNLPALDPGNVLLAPVLAHEVAHTAVTQSLDEKLRAVLDQDELSALFESCCSELKIPEDGEAADRVRTLLLSWFHELLCDAVALLLCGPSFLFAFLAFAPPSSVKQPPGTHPPVSFRVVFALEILVSLGWDSALRNEAGELMTWIDSVGKQTSLVEGPVKRFLTEATERSTAKIVGVAQGHIASHFKPDNRLDLIRVAAAELAEGLPVAQIDNQVLDPWEIVLAAWFGGIKKHQAVPASIAAIAGDRAYSELIVKAVEYSGIVDAWKRGTP